MIIKNKKENQIRNPPTTHTHPPKIALKAQFNNKYL